MNQIETIFDNIGKAITSLAAVIFVMLMTITGMIFFSHTLFTEVFPASMSEWEKFTATWLMALGWEFTVLITTCNTRHINRHIPLVMAVSSGVIVLFFIQAFDSSQTLLTLSQRWFVGILAATINYIYAELFYAKWQERNQQQQLPSRLDETERNLIHLQSDLNEARSNLNESERELNEAHKSMVELKQFKAKVQQELTCPHCKVPQQAYGALQAHKGYCDQNPNRRKAKEINGNT